MKGNRQWFQWIRLNRKSVLVTFLVSYLIIFLIPVALGIVFYLRTETAIEEQAGKTNQAMLEQIREMLDGHLKEVEQLMLQVALNPKVKEFVNRMSSSSSLTALEYVELKETLRSIKTSSRFIYDFYLYFLDDGIIVTPSTKSDDTVFYEHYFSYPGLSFTDWKLRLHTGYQYLRYFPSEAINKEDERIRMLTVQQTLPIEEKAHPHTTLVILIDEQIIRDLFKNMEYANSGNIFIVDEKGQIIVSSGGTVPQQAEEMLDRYRKGSYSYYDPSRREEMILSHAQSGRTTWYYISAIPKSAYTSKIQTIKNWALWIVSLSFIIGFYAILYMSKRQYHPVKQLMAALPQIKFASGDNEYSLIQKKLENVLHEEKKMHRLLQSHAPLIKANFLTRLLHGQIDDKSLDSAALESLDIIGNEGLFAVSVIGIDDIFAFDDRNSEESWALARFIITNISLDLIRTRHRGDAVDIDKNRLALLINLSTRSEGEAFEELKRISENIHSFLRIRFKMGMTIGVGRVYPVLPQIHDSYREALKALDFKIIEGSNTIIHYSELTPAAPLYYYPLELETQLVNLVKSGNMERTEQLIDGLIETNFRNQTLSPAMSKYLFFDLIGTLIKVMDMFNIKPGLVWDSDRLDPIRLYAECGTSSRMKEELIRAYSEVCRYLKSDRRPSTFQQVRQIEEFIQKRFGEGDLSLISIGEAFAMNPNYVSSFFKKHTGQNLVDYIAKIRVQEAKNLLQTTSLTVTQIAEKVGYANDVGFARMFKKLEGITPGKYRELQSAKCSCDI
ncbi:helix-turn-helix domain-containing protein [Paenibacillus piri]|nr:helix-turn-helix domain-containing protein [Paenibacillus piri]